ncbi:type A chloramphenicol O-acetyltransferase [Paludicola sp. MB14-C6]|uniref:type A chloramphenicol O-acetyltransferase n=1 Tax=Paludihabitans sp. MB14-C6 TaxID=3070656 RepID=UPI0027DE16FE|nr:type A chloramphenicol O-acetyltransferase [Paludicola sp. MB14-C6]WMJ23400.1 type A chloramphenicol O-acetyltransferase [Paludicola sp. MB14-C6]
MNFNYIDIENWKRKEYFNHYLNTVRCTYSMTANIDITNLLALSKKSKKKLYPVMIYMITTVVNKHEEFRCSFDTNKKLGCWNKMNPSYTIFHKEDESFSSIWSEYNNDLSVFYGNAMNDIQQYSNAVGFLPKPNEPSNTFPISCIPWTSFTGFQLNIYNEGDYLLPIFTIGRYFEQDGKWLLPISIQVHHAVCDGYHVSRFINELNEMAANANEWFPFHSA